LSQNWGQVHGAATSAYEAALNYLRIVCGMTKEQIQNAFLRLGQVLHERGVTGEIAVFGGAAVVLGFDFRKATQDVDSLVTEGHGQVMQAAQQVEKEQQLPPNWLLKHYYSDQQLSPARTIQITDLVR